MGMVPDAATENSIEGGLGLLRGRRKIHFADQGRRMSGEILEEVRCFLAAWQEAAKKLED